MTRRPVWFGVTRRHLLAGIGLLLAAPVVVRIWRKPPPEWEGHYGWTEIACFRKPDGRGEG